MLIIHPCISYFSGFKLEKNTFHKIQLELEFVFLNKMCIVEYLYLEVLGFFLVTEVTLCFVGLLQYFVSEANNADHSARTKSENTAGFQKSCLH